MLSIIADYMSNYVERLLIYIYICKEKIKNRDHLLEKFYLSVSLYSYLDHLTFWVGNAKQAAAYYTSKFGF
jgi:hypothetical protein